MRDESKVSFTVALPIYNEEANLDALLRMLTNEPGLVSIFAVDDHSTDRSRSILDDWERQDARVRPMQNPERSGQLAAWILAARTAQERIIVFIDADAMPDPGAIAELVAAIDRDPAVVAASGRVIPDRSSGAWPPARFRARVLHRVRLLNRPKEAIIGRFFAVKRTWFLETIRRPDIIANDAYLGASAARAGMRVCYVPRAICRYVEADSVFDFAAQRQRADAGYSQLAELGVLRDADGPHAIEYLFALMREAVADPIGAVSWVVSQMKARRLPAYRISGRDRGGWETQASTKRSLD